jgi:hypothetical protein
MKEAFVQRMPLVAVAVLSMLTASAVVPVQAQSTDEHPIVGTWSLNLIRSSFEPGSGPQAMTRRFILDDDGFLVSIRTTVNGAGNPTFALVRMKIDGNDYKVWTNGSLYGFITAQTRPGATGAMEAIDDKSFRLTQRNAEGEMGPLSTNTWTVSTDGHTLTVATSGTTADGENVHNVEVFDKVRN